MPFAVETFDLTKYFKQRGEIKKAVEGLNIKVVQGELFGILGPNGAGKTTLLKILATLILPSRGTALIMGKDIIEDAVAVRALLGFISGEERSFYGRLSGRKNLEFFANLSNIPSSLIKKRIKAVLELLDLETVAELPFQIYSSGMRQKLAIARALLPDPPVMLIDELSKSLDPLVSQSLRTFLKEKLVKEQRKTIILATHNLEEAESLSEHLAIMDEGKIKAWGTVDELTEQGKINLGELLRRFASQQPSLEGSL